VPATQLTAQEAPMQIDGTVALVTGANPGIGKAFVDALLERGAANIYAAVRDVTTVGDVDSRLVPVQLRGHRHRAGRGSPSRAR
jgi:NAD(P)-dependent dehydrogenase (short-subunit alcohol dehydrogenase family)